MKIAIIGVGGVGGYFGGRLSEAGFDVTFVARGESCKALKNNGLTVKSILGNIYLKNIKVVNSISKLKNIDFVILGVKAFQVKEVAKELSSVLKKSATVLPLQNGILATEELSKYLKKENIIGGVCRIISFIEKPGIINHTDVNPTIVFGELDNRLTDRVKKIKLVFDKGKIKSKISENIKIEIWKKFIGICLGGYIAMKKSCYGEVRENGEGRNFLIGMMEEIIDLANLENVKIEKSFIEKTMSFIDTIDYNSTTSLARDIWAKKPTELEYLNGTVVKLAKKHNYNAKLNALVYSSLISKD